MIRKYFKLDDAALITWGHGINNKKALHDALNGDIMFIESDIVFNDDENEVFMTHPPSVHSDLTYSEWLRACESDKRSIRGLKLDFKCAKAVEICLEKLKQVSKSLSSTPIMLNADVFKSTNSVAESPIEFEYFVRLCLKYYPDSVLSLGWTTKLADVTSTKTAYYSWADVLDVYSKIEALKIEQEITFPCRASWTINSLNRLYFLLNKIPKSSLTIWSHENDIYPSKESLLLLRKFYEHEKVFYDLLPRELQNFIVEKFKKLDELNECLLNSTDNFIKFIYPVYSNFNSILWTTFGNAYIDFYSAVLIGNNSSIRTKDEYKIYSANSNDYIEIMAKFELVKKHNNKRVEIKTGDRIEISFRSSIEPDNSNISISILIELCNDLVKLKIGNNVVKELQFKALDIFEINIKDFGESKEFTIDIETNSYDLKDSNLINLCHAEPYLEKQQFYVIMQLISENHSIGIDRLKILNQHSIEN